MLEKDSSQKKKEKKRWRKYVGKKNIACETIFLEAWIEEHHLSLIGRPMQ